MSASNPKLDGSLDLLIQMVIKVREADNDVKNAQEKLDQVRSMAVITAKMAIEKLDPPCVYLGLDENVNLHYRYGAVTCIVPPESLLGIWNDGHKWPHMLMVKT